VFSLPNDVWGEEVVAAIVVDSALYDEVELRDRLASELAAHKRPKRFCVADALPHNRSGKVDRTQVAAQCSNALRAI
jgi:acyl-CoA synthetase (AMP-forming)/AMP-acid ligase II